ncbi:hypothetical protein [Coralliovum pocilloporae]|uniref:hypothetical protein n=1 Tax=Coralliovum pocilloporae TaxID=3066369 RepID=UPI0033073693
MDMPSFETPSSKTKKIGLTASILSLIIGLIFLYLLVELGLLEKIGDGAFIALMFLPLIIYALVAYSERISEVSAGGIAVKFTQFAHSEVATRPTSSDAEADIHTINIIEKSSHEALRMRRDTLSPGDKVAITIHLGRGNYYSEGGIHHYLNILLAQDADMPVIFVDSDGLFIASTMGVKLRDALSDAQGREQQRRFIKAIEKGMPKGIRMLQELVAITTTSVEPKTTNSEALRAMLSEDVPVLISVDTTGKPTGVVRRDAIMAQMLVSLASE